MATAVSYASHAPVVLEQLQPLREMGYHFEAAGECIRIMRVPVKSHTCNGCRYVSIAGLMSSKHPVRYALAMFAMRG